MELLEAPQARLPCASRDLTDLLEARAVGRAAEEAVLSLPVPRDRAFATLYNYLAVDEPAVHLMPLHFLPGSSRHSVECMELHSFGVAAKLEYVRSRWIDEIVDAGCGASLLATHNLHDELVELILTRYSEVLRGCMAGEFFQTLAKLYAHHGASLAVDGSGPRFPFVPLTQEEYASQVRARNGSFRASLDAVLLFTRASAETLLTARRSWHLWVLGAQLYDDALDVEEDFHSRSPTWAVTRTLAGLDADAEGSRQPDRDAFYEAALVGGAVEETLTWAESCFRSASDLADVEFPSWAALQRACITQTSRLRADFQDLSARLRRK